MKKIVVNFLLAIARFTKKRVKYNNYFTENSNQINLGCGMRCIAGWVNIDGSLTSLFGSNITFLNKILFGLAGSSAYCTFDEYNDVIKNKKLYWYNLVDGVPFESDSVDVVFTSHFLEHMSKDDGYHFLKEIYRVVKKGGLIRILVPDLDIGIKQFNESNIDETQDTFFYTSQFNDFACHRYNYTYGTLEKKLKEIGFDDIVKQSHQLGECPDIEYLDVYPGFSLYVEARKP